MSLISLVDAGKSGSLRNAIAKSLDLVDFTFQRDAKSIVIKPNMCYYWDHSTGETTDPRFVKALVDVLRNRTSRNIDISVVESDASAMRCQYVFRFLGFEKMVQENGLNLINLSDEEGERVTVSVGDKIFHPMVPRIIRDADLRINVPKIKYQMFTKLSCALKNIFGCNPYRKKFQYHSVIDETIVALNKAMSFDLCVVDGIVTCSSRPIQLDLVMTSVDPVAVDCAAAKLLRINPDWVNHIMLAKNEGLGNTSLSTIGESLPYFKRKFPRRSAKSEIMEFGYKLVTKMGLSNRLGL